MLANQYADHHEQLVDLRATCNHPISLLYSEIFSASLHTASINDGRIQPHFPISRSPFYQAVQAGLAAAESRVDTARISECLRQFYDAFQPATIDAWFGLNSQNPVLLTQPPWSAIFPWRARSLDAYGTLVADAACREMGVYNNAGVDPGVFWGKCGPVLPAVIDNETHRLTLLVDSIRSHGYQRSNEEDSDIVATALVNDDHAWVWIVTSGYHRACVLAALGYTEVTVRINKVVIRNQWKFWPQLLDGLYTETEALTIFDNIFAGIGRK